ncbi:unnamed protein product [Rotaria sp. Silwood2]|nr:unnamed protein product [Rotaria sp. Silwood2]CAF4437632.1 unnamed protein product [Rotaria sp. Silwood2]
MKQIIELNRLQDQVNQLIREQNMTLEQINTIDANIRFTKQQTNELCLNEFTLPPLTIDGYCITIKKRTSRVNIMLPLPASHRLFQGENTYYSIAANDNYILVGEQSKLRLFDQQLNIQNDIIWNHGRLNDICWSSTLARFFLITPEEIFTFDDKTLVIQQCQITRSSTNTDFWYCGTCFEDTLFLSTWNFASSVFKYSLKPSIQCINQYQPPVSCKENESIKSLASNHQALALMIVNTHSQIHFDLCSFTTLERFRIIQLGSISNCLRIRCCSLNSNQWVVINPNNSAILQISENEIRIAEEIRSSKPWDAILLNNDALVILLEKDIHLHSLL